MRSIKVEDCPLRVARVDVEGVRVTPSTEAFARLQACGTAYRAQWPDDAIPSPGAVDGVQVMRTLYRSVGLDPTKNRPSSEALLRRVLKNKPLYHVNALVDVGNWCALDWLLSLGLYDRDHIHGTPTLRRGRPGERYPGIGKPPVDVSQGVVLVDDQGPFGSPTSDSQRTAISENTERAVLVVFAPDSYDAEQLKAHAHQGAERIVTYCGGVAGAVYVSGGESAGP